jgi:hypothetical protein
MESTAPEKKGMPTWAKILIGVGVAFVVGIVGILVAAIIFFTNMSHQAVDPVQVKRVAASMLTIGDPLPDGFGYSKGLDLLGMKMVAFSHDQDGLQLIFTSIPSNKSAASLEESINESTDNQALNQVTSGKSRFQSKSKGTEQVGGKTLTYAIGTTEDNLGQSYPSMMGVITPSNEGRLLMVIGLMQNKTDDGKPIKDPAKTYNIDATKAFLKAIKKI